MYWANVDENILSVSGQSVIVVGNANANQVVFSFSDEWDGLMRVAVFRNSINVIAVEVPRSGTITIPWECCEEVGDVVYLGAYGLDSDGMVKRPTTWTTLGTIVDGVDINGAGCSEPTKSIYLKLLDKVEDISQDVADSQDSIHEISGAIEDLENSSTSNREKLDALEESNEFFSIHGNLKQRDDLSQHPISAIDGLEEAIGSDLVPSELDELLGGETT